MKTYIGRVPACGVFCGGCPSFTQEKKACAGATVNAAKCEGCFYDQCTKTKGILFCHDCEEYPCARYKQFSNRWRKHGQDFMANQELIKTNGAEGFLATFNEQVKAATSGEKRIVNSRIKGVELKCAGCPHCG